MWKIYKVAQREYAETVRTRTFLLGLLIVPLIVVAMVFLGERMKPDRDGPREPIRVAMTSTSRELSEKVEAAFKEYNESHPRGPIVLEATDPDEEQAEERGKEKLRQGRLDAYVVLTGDLGGQGGAVRFYAYKPRPSQLDALGRVEGLLRDAIVSHRYESRGLDRTMLDEIRNVPLQWIELGQEQGQEQVQGKGQRLARMMVPFAFMYMIFMGIVGMGQHMTSSIIEEKNSRIVEVLLSAITPFELMAGKIAGLAGVGLTVMALWGTAAYAAADWQGFQIEIGADLLAYALVYYILGFVLFSAVLAGVGSVCNTIKETQGLMMPIMLLFIIPIIAWPRLAQDPNGELARVLSFVPPVTPMVMVLRLSSGTHVPAPEVIASIVVLIAGVLATVWAAAKVFRTGILLYGKRPGPREVLRWLWEK